MRLSREAYDFFGQEHEGAVQVRRVLEGKPLRTKKKEIKHILEKTKEVTDCEPVFDEIKYSGRLRGRSIAKTSGSRRVRLTLDDTFYGFPEALQIMVIAHENVHALDRKQVLKRKLRKNYGVKDGLETDFKSHMSASNYEREAATHLLTTKMLANDFFRDFRYGINVKKFENKFRRQGNDLKNIEERGLGMATILYPSEGIIIGSSPTPPSKRGKPDAEILENFGDYSILDEGDRINQSQRLEYKFIEGSCCYRGENF